MLRIFNYKVYKTGKGENRKVRLEVPCPMCGEVQKVEMTEREYNSLMVGTLSVQESLPNHNAFDRETLISGMCHDCQSKMFNRPKPGEDWGPILGECGCCGARIYEKDNGKCSQCDAPFPYVEEDGEDECAEGM